MSWQETQEKEKTLNEQFEFLQQDMDRLMLAQSQLYENIEKNTNVLTQETRKAQQSFARLDQKRDQELEWIKAQQAVVSALTAELEKTFKEREKKTVLIKKWLELAFYGVLVIITYQALTTSLWQTLGFQELYKQVQQFKYGGLVVTVVYILLNSLALVWLVKKLVKSWS
ncbi:hypothetical protein QUE96_13565 [Lactococcus lactis]|uniref:hypothetical protein n=1 Tax=Lactococcus lactis TaxID=1358 RepID=UPI0025A217A2|nr:hypothetical protein [Lactococcus lactis]MDM7657613.1 hypothetical protein [Lactococcus lactis]